MTLPPLATTAMGSLPHREIGPALEAAFRVDVPCLPSLPRRSVAEGLVPQGLWGLPGLTVDATGRCVVDPERWRSGRIEFQRMLKRAIDDPAAGAVPFSTSDEAFCAWEPFLRELEARRAPLAKVQLVGPFTATRHAFLPDGRPLAAELGISNQVFQLLAARALILIAAVQRTGAQPLFVFDEPALGGLALDTARNRMATQELRALVRALRKAGAWVGLHCCSDAQWERLLPLGLDLLCFDAALSLPSVLQCGGALEAFVARGGRLGLGVVPTGLGTAPADCETLATELLEAFAPHPELLRSAILTPACGLAGHTEASAGAILAQLAEVQSALARRAALT